MAVDLSIYDFRQSFTVHEAALAWAETEYSGENIGKAYQSIFAELLRDVKANVLQHRVKRKIVENWIKWNSDYSDMTNWSTAEIWRADLKRWAEQRGRKPKFLFPEMREQESKLVGSDIQSVIQEANIGAHQKRIAEWKTIAIAQWKENAELTQTKVAQIIQQEDIENKKGQFSLKTITKHIKELDPRENRVGRRKKQLVKS